MLCLVTSMNIVLAQNRKITGTVVSAEDNEPVIGAAVVVRGTQIGIVTDVDGVFSLEVPAFCAMRRATACSSKGSASRSITDKASTGQFGRQAPNPSQ